jgi:ABC-2 type transport system ATP-binding protein
MIRYEGVSKRFSGAARPALDALDMEVSDGEILGLVGLNGAGKSTALRLAAGVAYPTSGGISVDGNDVVRQKRKSSAHLGWVPETPNFDLQERARPYLIYLASFHDIPRRLRTQRCDEVLQQVGLTTHEDERLSSFSRGMFKRFGLAAALLSNPTNYLLDELFSELDPQGTLKIESLLLRFKNRGCAILLSSHDLRLLERLADRVAVLHEGRLLRILERTAAGFHIKTERSFIIRVSDSSPEILKLLESFGRVSPEGNGIRLTETNLEGSELLTRLVSAGVRVNHFREDDETLGGVFVNLVSEEK